MIVWIKKEASGRNNDQRAKILVVDGKDRIINVIFCGDTKPRELYSYKPSDIAAVELKGVKLQKLKKNIPQKSEREKFKLVLPGHKKPTK